ncbi:hypothetical protein SteCoe_35694 [Stentor coeruleus]|uniref:Uncharacterized protein n=1 Tax=Stentor coeruleus TaxID=5963 RepID=A0A1R2ARQ3_9CILI|nr:hypothetical protein SteCoe_35694 [Stentor coeruleus]
MGSEWSCPCAERDRVRRRLPLTHEIEAFEDNFPQLSLQIKAINSNKLEKVIKRPQAEHIISSISKHPLHNKPLLVSQISSELEYSYSSEGKFTMVSVNFDTTQSLAESIKEKCSAGFILIGGFSDGGKIKLVYFSTRENYEREFVVRMEDFVDLTELKSIFLDHQGYLYVGCIEHNDSALIIFEKSVTPRPIKYLVAEYPITDAEELDFDECLSEKVNECTANKEVRFRGCLSFKTALFLIFIQ